MQLEKEVEESLQKALVLHPDPIAVHVIVRAISTLANSRMNGEDCGYRLTCHDHAKERLVWILNEIQTSIFALEAIDPVLCSLLVEKLSIEQGKWAANQPTVLN